MPPLSAYDDDGYTEQPNIVPSSFLPHLPRSQSSFAPHLPVDILAHIAVLKELYVPPIHGGFDASDWTDRHDLDAKDGLTKKKERRFSVGLAETMDGLGLDLETNGAGPSSNHRLPDVGEYSNEDEEEEIDGEEDDEEPGPHLDPFERDWAEKWLSGVVRRAQGCIEEHEEAGTEAGTEEIKEAEVLLRDATAVLAMMAGTSAAGSLTRHLLFPLDPSLAPGLRALRPALLSNPTLSPTTHTFLSSLATSPTSPLTLRRPLETSPSEPSTSPSSSVLSGRRSSTSRPRRRRPPAVPVLLHDAPMSDHLSVGVQTWGSAILLGRRMARHPDDFGLFQPGIRILELGAGTGLLSILCRKLLDLHAATAAEAGDLTVPSSPGRARPRDLVVATDFLPEVLANLKICVDLNTLPSTSTTSLTGSVAPGIQIAKLDWTTFPSFMDPTAAKQVGHEEEEMAPYVDRPFDLVLASDCVYDPTHAALLREVASWVLRLPDESGSDRGGTFHILSPIRPTFTPELESIDRNFPPHPHPALAEGLGRTRGLRLGTRGGKRSMKGKKGEGRVDEGAGYWWWEVGWA